MGSCRLTASVRTAVVAGALALSGIGSASADQLSFVGEVFEGEPGVKGSYVPAPDEVVAGETFSMLVWLSEPTLGLAGYSLNVDVAAEPGASGEVTANFDETNFFPDHNLILAGGSQFNDALTFIADPGDGGVFIQAFTIDFEPIDAVLGINDILAQVVFDVSPDASGLFTFSFGNGTQLSHVPGIEVTFDTIDHTVTVVPEPTTVILLAAGMAWGGVTAARRRRRSERATANRGSASRQQAGKPVGRLAG